MQTLKYTCIYLLNILFFYLSYFLFPPSPPPPLSLCLQGRCVISVQLTDEELVADDKGVDYFLLFAGSTQRHLTSTLRNNHDTLHALCPGKPHLPQFPAALTNTADKCVGRQLHLQCSMHVQTETFWSLLASVHLEGPVLYPLSDFSP